VPKYREFSVRYPRRLVFIGTTNHTEFLVDDTGNRRWLPVPVERLDVEGIELHRGQLWAEGAALFALTGVDYAEAEALATEVHDAHMISEPWTEVIGAWLDAPDPLTGEAPRTREFLRMSEIAQGALGINPRYLCKREEHRIATAMRSCCYQAKLKKVNRQPIRVWINK
jgi:predicted P-loop ATPase